MSYYIYSDFKKACGEDKNNIVPINSVLKDASDIFNLRTKDDLYEFIYNDGLEDLQFVNTKDWENNPNPSIPIKVDAYKFRSMHKLGYIAFMFSDKSGKWIIKSFHLSDDRNPAMAIALKKAGLLPKEG